MRTRLRRPGLPGTRARRRRVSPLGTILGFLLLCFAVGCAAPFLGRLFVTSGIRARLFAVRHVAVRGLSDLGPDEILALADVREGDDAFSVTCDAISARVLSHPRVRSVRTERTIPPGFRITVVERRPVALVRLTKLWEVDSDGVLLPPLRSGEVRDLPLLTGIRSASEGPAAHLNGEGQRRALRALVALRGAEPVLLDRLSEIDAADPDHLTAVLTGGGVPVRIGPGEIPPSRWRALREALRDLDARGARPESFDLRFRGQVVVRLLT